MKVLKALGIVLLVIIVLIIVGVVALSIAISDSTDNTPEALIKENPTLEQVINEVATKSLSTIVEQPDVNIVLDGPTLNRALYAALTNIDGMGVLSFNGAYSTFEENGSLYVEVPIRFLFAKSCIYAQVQIKDDNETLSVKFEDVKVGKLDSHSFLIRTFLLTHAMSRSLEKSLADIGLTINIDLPKLSADTTHISIADMIASLTAEDPNAPLYTVLSHLCLTTPELLEIQPKTSSIDVCVHTAPLTYDTARDGALRYPLDMKSVQEKVNTQTLSLKNVSPLYHYYVKGYEQLDEKEKPIIDACGLSKSEKGIAQANGLDIAGAMLTQRPNLPLVELIFKQSYSVMLEAKTADAIIGNLPFIGSCFAFTDGQSSVYIAVEGTSVTFDQDTLHICLVMNVNGRRISLSIDGSCPPGTGEELDVTINRVAFGSYELSQQYIENILAYLAHVLETQTWLVPKPDHRVISIMLSEVLANTEGFEILRSNCSSTAIALEPNRLKLTYYFLKKA